jgi:RNA recognition motif-containing protein
MSAAKLAMQEMDGYEFQGRKLQVQFAQGDRKTPGQMRRKEE